MFGLKKPFCRFPGFRNQAGKRAFKAIKLLEEQLWPIQDKLATAGYLA
jgi:hypothetical protein